MAHVTVHVKFSADFDTDCDATDEKSALDDIIENERLKDKLLNECYDNMSVIAGLYDEEELEYDIDEDFEEDEDITKPEVKKEENK